MTIQQRTYGLHPAWWAAILVAVIVSVILSTVALYTGAFRRLVPVTLISDRSGLVMETGGKVKLRGVEVGWVEAVSGGSERVSLQLNIFPDQIRYIPANVEAEIRATTAFGAKFVDLVVPPEPSPNRIGSGSILRSHNVSTEVNTVFENLTQVLAHIDPPELNAALSALARGVRGQGAGIGQAITDADQVLLALNARTENIGRGWLSWKGFTDTYGSVTDDIVAILDAASVTSTTVVAHASALDALLLSATGLSESGLALLAPNQRNLVTAIDVLKPTTALLEKYHPTYTCLLVGAKWFLDNGGYSSQGGNGRTLVTDSALLLGDDMYRYPENLPIVGAKGGPGGKPGCGSLPIVDHNMPVRQLVTNTGWGAGLDLRPNPGIGHPWYANFFPVTRAVPEPPSIRGVGPPAVGPPPPNP